MPNSSIACRSFGLLCAWVLLSGFQCTANRASEVAAVPSLRSETAEKFAARYGAKEVTSSSPVDTATCVVADIYPDGDLGQKINAALASVSAGAVCVKKAGPILTQVNLRGAKTLILAPGTYLQRASIVLSGTGPVLRGGGFGNTSLTFGSNAHGSNVFVAAGTDSFLVEGLALVREAYDAIPGDSGLTTQIYVNRGTIRDLRIVWQYDGLYLGTTGISTISNLYVESNKRAGLLGTNLGTHGPLQWHLRQLFFGENQGPAILLSPDGGTMSLGNWDGIMTFANGGPGLQTLRIGTNTVEGLRVSNSFFGNDALLPGYSNIQIDGGAAHMFTNVFLEQAGQHPREASLRTVSHGFHFSSSVQSASLNNVTISGNGGNGIVSLAQNLLIANSTISNNGMAVSRGSQGGFLMLSGSARLMGNQFVNSTGTQLVPLQASVTDLSLVGNTYVSSAPPSFLAGPPRIDVGNLQQ